MYTNNWKYICYVDKIHKVYVDNKVEFYVEM